MYIYIYMCICLEILCGVEKMSPNFRRSCCTSGGRSSTVPLATSTSRDGFHCQLQDWLRVIIANDRIDHLHDIQQSYVCG